MKRKSFLLILLALVAFGPTAWAQDLIINSDSDWDTFADNVNSGTETYYGKTVKLNADISVSTMVGNSTTNSFQGTFNGGGHTIEFTKGSEVEPFNEDYCAPFRYIRSATIKNLHTTGTIYTSGQRAGGIVATATFPFGCTLSSCRSSVTIHGTNSDYGGLVAHVNFETETTSRNFNITNCLFDGTLNNEGISQKWGGFIGWVTHPDSYMQARLNITNCLFNPVAVPSVSDGKTFARYNGKEEHINIATSCYYKMTLGDAQGTDARGMDNNTLLANLGSGWEIQNNEVIPVMPSLRPFSGGAGTEESPYQIADATDWDNLAYNVDTCEESYSGKYFKLTNSDLNVTTMVGTSGVPFRGTFDGDGNTLTINLTATDNYCAPFRYINGATIKHLHVEGNINGNNKKQLAGLVGNGNTTGTNTISNCSVNVSMTTTFSGDASIGGLIANISTGTTNVEGCAFTGSFNCPNANNVGGLVGWRDWKAGAYATLSLTNCLFMPTSVNFSDHANNQPLVRSRDNSTTGLTITNCYITNPIHDGNLQGKQADTITGSNVTVENAGNPSSSTTIGVIGYGTGIKYNNVLYAGDGDEVSLSLTVPMGKIILSATYTPDGGSAEAMTHQAGNVYSFTMPEANVTINVETGYWVNGTGTANDPFQIATTADFDTLSKLVREVPYGHPFYQQMGSDQIFSGYYFILMNDLDYTNKTFNPVGYYSVSGDPRGFKGTFDGQGHVIKGINYVATESKSTGIFGFATGDISNLALVSSNLTGGNNTGGIVGYYNGGTISNCHVASDVNIYTPTGSTIIGFHGGIVGRKYAGTISYCTSAAHIVDGCTTYGNHFGGIVGYNDSGSVNHCLFTGDIVTSVSTDNKGPIAGSNHGTLTNCYWTNPSFGTGSGDVALAPSTNYDNSGFINTITVIQNKMTVASYSPAFKALAPIGLTISAWNNNDNPVGGWYFIASPVVGDIAPDAVMNLLGTQMPNSSLYNFDLYRFNQSPDMINGEYKEWENYHQHNETEEPFLLENGKGYLYARSAETTLTFTGTFNTSTEPVDVTLTYETTNPKAIMHGWNLVGNPFPVTAYVNRPFYKMNDAGTGIVPVVNDFNSYTPTTIPTCTGIMVQTTADEVTQGTNKVTFSTTVPTQQATNNGNLQIALSQSNTRGNALLDNAIVSFNEDDELGKFYFGEQNANIYIPQGSEEYAIAYSNKQGEMPLNFKATKDGEYSLNVNPENVEMSYLHLIDNMTGADIDLLQNPSYSFNATTTDYESRFKLVFSANTEDGPSTGSGTFAFYSNGNWIIANEGEATLQVVDLMGRILSSETINGSVSKAINTVPGVYMIRLINGENVKVQKVVIE